MATPNNMSSGLHMCHCLNNDIDPHLHVSNQSVTPQHELNDTSTPQPVPQSRSAAIPGTTKQQSVALINTQLPPHPSSTHQRRGRPNPCFTRRAGQTESKGSNGAGACGSLPASCCNRCKVDNACLKSDLCLNGTVLEPCFLNEATICSESRGILVLMVSVIFIRKSIPSSTKIFVSMIFNHSNTEYLISHESVMDSLEISLFAFLLQLVSRIIFFVSRLFTISMSMRSSLLDDILKD